MLDYGLLTSNFHSEIFTHHAVSGRKVSVDELLSVEVRHAICYLSSHLDHLLQGWRWTTWVILLKKNIEINGHSYRLLIGMFHRLIQPLKMKGNWNIWHQITAFVPFYGYNILKRGAIKLGARPGYNDWRLGSFYIRNMKTYLRFRSQAT